MDKEKKQGRSRELNKPNNKYTELWDIIREHALRYLPAKSLYRCNAVCRDWKLQASNPFFVHSQSYFFNTLSGVFCQTLDGSLSFLSLDPMAFGVPDPELKFLPEPVDLLASSNGLLCCRGHTEAASYYVCNPVNQQWKKLPKPVAEHGAFPAVVLIFEPLLLRFDADFKIVVPFCSADISDAYEFEIYSSIDNLWKISPEICFGEEELMLERGGVHVNGVVYWKANSYSLIGFDLKKNRATMITCPAYDISLETITLGVIDGKLCASERRGARLSVWVLSDVYGDTMDFSSGNTAWVEQCTVLKIPNVIFDEIKHERSVLAAGSNLIVFTDGSAIFSHDIESKEIKTLCSDAYDSSSFHVPYVNSLVCL